MAVPSPQLVVLQSKMVAGAVLFLCDNSLGTNTWVGDYIRRDKSKIISANLDQIVWILT